MARLLGGAETPRVPLHREPRHRVPQRRPPATPPPGSPVVPGLAGPEPMAPADQERLLPGRRRRGRGRPASRPARLPFRLLRGGDPRPGRLRILKNLNAAERAPSPRGRSSPGSPSAPGASQGRRPGGHRPRRAGLGLLVLRGRRPAPQPRPSRGRLTRLLEGQRVGWALEWFNQYYAALSVRPERGAGEHQIREGPRQPNPVGDVDVEQRRTELRSGRRPGRPPDVPRRRGRWRTAYDPADRDGPRRRQPLRSHRGRGRAHSPRDGAAAWDHLGSEGHSPGGTDRPAPGAGSPNRDDRSGIVFGRRGDEDRSRAQLLFRCPDRGRRRAATSGVSPTRESFAAARSLSSRLLGICDTRLRSCLRNCGGIRLIIRVSRQDRRPWRHRLIRRRPNARSLIMAMIPELEVGIHGSDTGAHGRPPIPA